MDQATSSPTRGVQRVRPRRGSFESELLVGGFVLVIGVLEHSRRILGSSRRQDARVCVQAPTADVQSKSPSLDAENSRSTSVQKTPKVPGNVRRKQTPPMLILPPKTIIPPTPSTKERAPEMSRGSFLICVEKMFCGCATITVDQSTEFSVPQLSVSEAAVDGQAAEVAVEGEEVTGAAFSDDSRSTAASEDDRPPLVRFAQTARVPAALRELDVLKKSGVDPLALLDQASLDQLHRIGDKYSEGSTKGKCCQPKHRLPTPCLLRVSHAPQAPS